MGNQLHIGFSAFATGGKDTAADILVAEHGYEKRGFADALRALCLAINPIVGLEIHRPDPPTDEERLDERFDAVPYMPTLEPVTYGDALERVGYNEAKAKYPEFRRILQVVGTEGCRTIFGQDVWVDASMRTVPEETPCVWTDVRFHNEADAIRAAGGIIVRIEREGVGPVTDHPSETEILDYDFDFVLWNDGTREDFERTVRAWAAKVLG